MSESFKLPPRSKDITGKKFHCLTAIRPVGMKNKYVLWEFKCDCGNIKQITMKHITSGSIKSCGCMKEKYLRSSKKTHGLSDHPLYMTWLKIKTRCYNEKSNAYHRYGGRGIKMCQEWKISFPSFLSDVGEKPSTEYQLDRIDNGGNYEPGNVRWVTPAENSRNSSTTILCEDDASLVKTMAKHMTNKEISDRTGISQSMIYDIAKGNSWRDIPAMPI